MTTPAKKETVVFLTGITSVSTNFASDFEYWRLEQSKMDNTKYNIVYANTGQGPDPHTGAVKLFAILTGYPVYFGEDYAHRFGVDVEKPNGFVAEHKAWSEDEPITFICHSNGVLIAYHLQYLLAKNHWKSKYGRDTSADMVRAIVGANAAFGTSLASFMNGGSYEDYETRTEQGLKEANSWNASLFAKGYIAAALLLDYVRADSLLVETNNAAYPFKIDGFGDLVATLTGNHVGQRKKCSAAWFLTFHGQKELQELWFADDVLPHRGTLYINLCGDKYDLNVNWHSPQDRNDLLTTLGALVIPFATREPEFEPTIISHNCDLFRHDGVAFVVHQAFPFAVAREKQQEVTHEMLSNAYVDGTSEQFQKGVFNWLVIQGGDHNLIKSNTENYRENVINRMMAIVSLVAE